MGKHSHRFVEEYDGLVGFGLDRQTDEYTLTYYPQKFSDDENMALIRGRMSDGEIDELFSLLTRMLKEHLTDGEYHRVFLKDCDR
ncbi:MAG: cytoplasmic protein [Deltaproteobacteria bacterium]|nr:cytoplasmic protein [Deltaproteobacteria bacterium]MBW2138585.1 cytoplasmic protein [Deltaproteobacteria bacterium]